MIVKNIYKIFLNKYRLYFESKTFVNELFYAYLCIN